MSYRPHGLGCLPPTSWIRSSELARYQAMSSSGPYRGPVVPARQACSHSASVGSRYPSAEGSHSTSSLPARMSYAGASPSCCDIALQNRTASHQETPSTGSRSPWAAPGRSPVTCAYCPWVTGNAARRYGASSTDHLRRVRRSDSVTRPAGTAIIVSSTPASMTMIIMSPSRRRTAPVTDRWRGEGERGAGRRPSDRLVKVCRADEQDVR